MRQKATILATLLFFVLSHSQTSFTEPPYGITQLTATNVAGGINVNVHVLTGGIIVYSDYSYTITGTTINLSVCYLAKPLPLESGLENDFFIPVTDSNIYTLIVTASGYEFPHSCVESTYWDSASTTILSNVEHELTNDNFTVFPNPAHDFVVLDIGKEEVSQVSIFGMLADIKMMNIEPATTEHKIDVTSLPNGIYILILMLKDSTFVAKRIQKI